MQLMHIYVYVNCVCFKMNRRYKINIIENKLPKTYLVNNKKKIKKNNLTVFEPKHPFRVCYRTNDSRYLLQIFTYDR